MPHTLYRALPATDTLLTQLHATHAALCAGLSRPMVRDLVNNFLQEKRILIKEGRITDPAALGAVALLPSLAAFVGQHGMPHFRRVLNATGVVIHTNLGRSLLAPEAAKAAAEAAAWYSNLEFNLHTGARGSRYSHVEELLCSLTGAEAALVVNNNAAAVFLMLDSLCKGKEVVVSRGELVEIGGSFRIPEVMEKSGCTLHEVGATNRTHLADYERAINENTAALMKVHTSNFRISGFVKQVPGSELVALAHRHGLPALEDLGSGSLVNWQRVGVPALLHEPTVQETVAAGLDAVSFSGDKVLGGPQAGIIVGSKETIGKMQKNPMNRALRIDKMTLAALEATLRLYTDPELALTRIPTLRMLHAGADAMRRHAQRLQKRVAKAFASAGITASVVLRAGESRVGGGAFPECDLPTTLVRVEGLPAEPLREALLRLPLPMVGRVDDDAFCLDPRTLQEGEDALVARCLVEAAQGIVA